MIKSAIDQGLDRIELDESGRSRIRKRIQEMKQSGVKANLQTTRRYRRTFRIFAVACILIAALSVFCIAAEVPEKFMSLFEPVDQVCVYDGIEMKTVSAVADDDSVMILYTMRDLKGSRISESTSIYDFSLSRATTLGTYSVGYDGKTKTATFCMAGDNGDDMKGRKLTMLITSFLDEAPMELHDTNFNLLDLTQQAGTSGESSFRDYNAREEDSFWNAQNQKGADLQEQFEEESDFPILAEGSMDIKIPGVDWVTVTNIGYKDGWLHVQVKYDEEKSEINHGYICLADSQGNELDHAILNSPLPDGGEEFVIRLGSAEQLKDVFLAGVFTNYETLNTGNWETTFQVKGVKTKTFAYEIKTDTAETEKAVLSPLGVTIYGKGTQAETVRVYMKGGTELVTDGYNCSGDGETGEFECKYKFSAPIDIQDVESISFAGKKASVPQGIE